MLKKLRDLPFVTLIFESDTVHIYTRGMDPEEMRKIYEVLAEDAESEEQ